MKRYNIWLKILSITVFVIAATIAASIISDFNKVDGVSNYFLSDLDYENYYETRYFNNEVSRAENVVRDLHTWYTDYDAVVAQVSEESNEEIIAKFNHETEYAYEGEVYNNGAGLYNFEYGSSDAKQAMYDFQLEYSAEINEIINLNIEDEIMNTKDYIESEFSGSLVYFFTTQDGTVVSNTSYTTVEEFESTYSTLSSGEENPSYNDYGGYQFAFEESYLTSTFIIPFEEFTESVSENKVMLLIVSLILMIPSFCYSIYAAGRGNSTQVTMSKVDKIYVDINVVMLAITSYIFLVSVVLINYERINNFLPLFFIIEITIILTLVLSLSRHVKNGTFFKHMFIRKIASRIW